MGEWQPIESAPKDEILIFLSDGIDEEAAWCLGYFSQTKWLDLDETQVCFEPSYWRGIT